MDTTSVDTLREIGLVITGIMGVSIFLFFLIILLTYRKLRTLDIPDDATLSETLHIVPIYLVIAFDLLDLGLDFFAAPVAWLVLDRLGLRALRNITTVEALIPATGPIPTLTLAWLAVRLFNIDI